MSGLSLTGSGLSLTDTGGGGGSGTVTSVSVATANGFAGTVGNPSTIPSITVSTTITGILKGDGTAVAAATAGTDYLIPGGALGTPSSGTMTNVTGLPKAAITGFGTGISTALGVNVGSAGAPVLFNGAGGTPSSLALTNATGLPVAGGGTGLATLTANNVILGNGASAPTFVAPGTSGNLLTSNGTTWVSSAAAGSGLTIGTTTITSGTSGRVLYDNAGVVGEMTTTGSGTVLALATSPSFTTPALGVATGTSLALNGAAISTYKLAVTGTSYLSDDLTFDKAGATNIISNTSDVFTLFLSNAAGIMQLRTSGGNINLFPNGGSITLGVGALATNATDGFTYISTCAGTPTGTPTASTGRVPLVYDTTNHQFWIYDGGWKQPKTPAGAATVTWQ